MQPFADLPPGSFAEDFEVRFVAAGAGTDLRFRGLEGLGAGWRNWLEAWDRYEIEAEEFIDAGDQVVVFTRVRARTHRDGVEMEHAPAAVWTLCDGVVQRIEFYLERDAALAAVGRL